MAATLEKGRITNKQLFYTVIAYILGGTLYMSFAMVLAKQDAWLTVILGFALCIFFAWIMISRSKTYPGKTLIQINEIVFGKVIGKAISALYLYYFLINTSLDIREIGNFITNYIMPETPMVVIIALFGFVCAYAVYNGISVIIRNAFLIGLLLIIALVVDSFLLISEMNFGNFFPMFAQPVGNYIQATLNVSVVPFDGLVALPMLLPFLNGSKSPKKPIFFGIMIGTIFMIWVVIRDWAVLGEAMPYISIPSFQALRLVKIGQIFTRVESIIATMLVAIRFFRCSILFYCFIFGMAQLFELKSYKPTVAVLSTIVIAFSAFLYGSDAEEAYFGNSISAQYILFFVFVLPVITLAVNKIKNKNKLKIKT